MLVLQFRQELHQTATMKFVTLALAVLLAVGCQAASLQANAPADLPTYLQHGRALLQTYGDKLKVSVHKIADGVEDQETKELIKTKIDELHAKIGELQLQIAPVTDSVVSTVHADIEALRSQLEPMQRELRDVVEKHLAEYKAHLDPILTEMRAEQKKQEDALRAKLESVIDELRAKIPANVEETKSHLMPILEAIRVKATERLEAVKVMLTPYIEEYKEQVKSTYDLLQSVNYDEVRQKMEPHLANVRAGLEGLLNEIRGSTGQ